MNSIVSTTMVNSILASNAIKRGRVATSVNTTDLIVAGIAVLVLVVCVAITVVAYKKYLK